MSQTSTLEIHPLVKHARVSSNQSTTSPIQFPKSAEHLTLTMLYEMIAVVRPGRLNEVREYAQPIRSLQSPNHVT